MDQLFFTNKDIFDLSYEAIFKKQWVFLTHLSYFNDNKTFNYKVNKGSIEIIQNEDNELVVSSSNVGGHCHLKI